MQTVSLNEKEVIKRLEVLRQDWASSIHTGDFAMRTEWLRGVIKGIDLSIWAIVKEFQG